EVLDDRQHGRQEMAAGGGGRAGERPQDVLFAALAEVGQGADLPGAGGGREGVHGPHAERLVERAYGLWPDALEAGEPREVDQAWRAVVLVECASSGGEQLLELLGHRRADAGNAPQRLRAALAQHVGERAVLRLDGLRRLLVGAWLELDAVHLEIGGEVAEDAGESDVLHHEDGPGGGWPRNSRSQRFTSSGCSCCTQWPESGM